MSFNYKAISDEDLRFDLRRRSDRIRYELSKDASEAIVELGTYLQQGKDSMPPDMFSQWCEAEFGWDEAQSDLFIDVAASYGMESSFSPTFRFEVLNAFGQGKRHVYAEDDTETTIAQVEVVVDAAGPVNEWATPYGFNYEAITDVDPSNRQAYIRSLCRDHAKEIKSELVRSANSILTIGRNLLEVKSLLQHGMFIKWLEVEFSWSVRQAQRFMSVAQRFGDKPAIFEMGLANSVIGLLAAPSCPDEAVEVVTKLARAGQPPSHRQAKEIIASSKNDNAVASSTAKRRQRIELKPDPAEFAELVAAKMGADYMERLCAEWQSMKGGAV